MGNIYNVCPHCKIGSSNEHEFSYVNEKENSDDKTTRNEINYHSKSKINQNNEFENKEFKLYYNYDDIDHTGCFFYENRSNLKSERKELDISFESEVYFPSFLIDQIEIKSLCVFHMTDIKTFNKDDNTTKSNTKLYVRAKLLKAIQNNLFEINQHLKVHLQINTCSSETFFQFETSKDNQHSNFINFKRKRYFLCLQDGEKSIFIFNSDPKKAKECHFNNEYIGVKILENGILFAGKFDDNYKLQGNGIYINKKGHLYIGNFTDSELSNAKVFTLNNILYEGTVKKLKRDGVNQREIKLNHYEFIGDFENDKRVRGKMVFYTVNPLNYIKSFETDDYKALSKQEIARVILTFEYYDKKFYYIGKISNNKLNDQNCEIGVNNINSFPKFRGTIVNNIKEGKGIYKWSEDDKYIGTFNQNKFNTNLHDSFILDKFLNDSIYDNDENFGTLYNDRKIYKVIFENGFLKNYKEI